jgi:hypothetical protein
MNHLKVCPLNPQSGQHHPKYEQIKDGQDEKRGGGLKKWLQGGGISF